MRTLVLWDIDNTLLYTGGAGSIGMRRAFADLYGVEDAFRRVEFSGRTDSAIFRDAAREHGLDDAQLATEQARFLDGYLPHLRTALHATAGRLMPGVPELLAALAGMDGVLQALGTGNFRAAGEIKLHHYGIAEYFPGVLGGFGEDSESRDQVIGMAIERLSNGSRPQRVVIIGDTPHDAAAAVANSALCLGVATGKDSVEVLQDAGAHVAVADLSDTAGALEFILG
jgi:phosphoglycolate phosphatase-like HAD superfamily hydrolase